MSPRIIMTPCSIWTWGLVMCLLWWWCTRRQGQQWRQRLRTDWNFWGKSDRHLFGWWVPTLPNFWPKELRASFPQRSEPVRPVFEGSSHRLSLNWFPSSRPREWIFQTDSLRHFLSMMTTISMCLTIVLIRLLCRVRELLKLCFRQREFDSDV